MPQELISLDRFRAELREGQQPQSAVYRLQVASPLIVDEAARKIRFVFSDGTLDRVGDTIDPHGWDTTAYLKNPVVLWAHDSWAPPIGRSSNLAVEASALCGDVEFAAPDIYDFADLIYRLVKAKYLNAGSVGFLPLEYSFTSDKERPFGIDFERQELLEYSICPVPANPNALAEARAHGIDTRPIVAWAERVLDGDGRLILPKAEIERMRRQAQEPRSRARKSEEWRCAASRELPLDQTDAWDGPGAAKRMLDAAGFEGDSPDPEKARRGFLICDGSKPELRGSYKLPFADIVDGQMKAVKGGIRAAASRLPQTDAPQSVLDDARKVVDHYEERFGMKNGKQRAGDGMGEGDPASGGYVATCGRALEAECGLKNPEECMVHGPALDESKGALAVLRRELHAIVAGVMREAGIGFGEPKEHLKHAREHVKAAYGSLKDLGEPENPQHEAVCDMHAHVKAAGGYLDNYRGQAEKSATKGALARLRREMPAINPQAEDLSPEEPLQRAVEHVKSAESHLKDLIVIDPDGDEDLDGNDAAQEHVLAMHAHMKAADGYLEHHRHLVDIVDPEAEQAARAARLEGLRAVS